MSFKIIKYDLLHRPKYVGLWSRGEYLDFGPTPDQNNDTQVLGWGFEGDGDSARFVGVNMYDKYLNTGVFSRSGFDSVWAAELTNLKGRLAAAAFRDDLNSQWNYRYYGYDPLGRVTVMFEKAGSLGWKKITNVYDNWGVLIKQGFKDMSLKGQAFYTWYEYDERGRLDKVFTNMTDSRTTAYQEADYSYYKDNQISRLDFMNLKDRTGSIKYNYNNRGWVSSIMDSILQDGDPEIDFYSGFYEALTYYKNGNIKWQTIRNTALSNQNEGFEYSYDNANRLIEVSSSLAGEIFNYDKDGNITNLEREGGDFYREYSYSAASNKLLSLSTIDDSYSFQYDYRGNMTLDSRKNLSLERYNHLNLPLKISSSIYGGDYTEFGYDNSGSRLFKKQYSHYVPVKSEYYLRDHNGRELGVFDLLSGRLKSVNIHGNDQIGKIDVDWEYFDGGDYWQRTDTRNYFIKDHLGSIRLTVDRYYETRSAQRYYAFGEERYGGINNSDDARYKYTGKERDTETGYDYFGARYYDAELHRWLTVDPLADKYPGMSPYNYVMNNPLILIDPDGRETSDPNEEEVKKKQEETWNDLLNFSNAVSKGLESIKNNVEEVVIQASNETSKFVTDATNEVAAVGQVVLNEGPGVLNNVSEKVALTSFGIATVSIVVGQPEIAAAAVVEGGKISTGLDIAAASISTINFALNPSVDNRNKTVGQLGNAFLGYALGGGMMRGAKKIAEAFDSIIKFNPKF